MSYFGNFKSNRFNESNPFFIRKRQKQEALRKMEEEKKRKAEEAKKNSVEDITHDTDG